MEKCRNESKTKSCKRLLVFITMIFMSLSKIFSQYQNIDIPSAEIYFKPVENQNFYENEDINFELKLENLNPTEIELESNNLPENVKLRLFRKMEQNGTLINVWLNFAQEGEFELEDFIFLLYPNENSLANPNKLHVKFPKIIITKNLSIQEPEIHIIFDEKNTVIFNKESSADLNQPEIIYQKKDDEKISFTIYAKYVYNILNFEYEIPKNAILTLTKEFEFTNYINQSEKVDYSEKLIPIASFEMISLQTGTIAFPKILLQLEDYQHQKKNITLENYAIEILQKSENSKEKEITMFDIAFEDLETQKQTEHNLSSGIHSKNEKTEEDCRKLLKKLKSDYQKRIFFIFILILAVLILLFIFISKKVIQRRKFFIIISFVSMLILISFIYFSGKNQEAVFLGGTVHSIPDEKSVGKTYLNTGTQIKLLKKSENWCFIEYYDKNDSVQNKKTGWCKTEDIVY